MKIKIISDFYDNEFTDLYQSIEDIIENYEDVLTKEQLKKLQMMMEITCDINIELNDPDQEDSNDEFDTDEFDTNSWVNSRIRTPV